MAKFLVNMQQTIGSNKEMTNQAMLNAQTEKERDLIIMREKTMKKLCELCMLRCLKPSMMKKSFEDFVSIVVDVKYNNFYDDIFSEFVDRAGTAELLKNNKKK
jgi:hypothetical protein